MISPSALSAPPPVPLRKRWRRVRIAALALLGLFLVLVTVVLVSGWRAFGHRVEGARKERVLHSPQWNRDRFVNPEPLDNDMLGAFSGLLAASDDVAPKGEVPIVHTSPQELAVAPPSGLRVTWFGHSSTLVEIDGFRVLTDPVWSERISPLSFVGPRPWFPAPIALSDLPHIDAVVVSHDHYDHLDYGTIDRMKGWDTLFIVPLGIGAHLAYWGVPESKIVELEWWQSKKLGDFEITCLPARHASGRMGIDNDAKLWAGYALVGPKHRVYYSGDTGLFPAMREIGKRFGPFDLSMIEVGQYHRAWPDWHIGPEQAVRAHELVGGKVMLPVHWGKLVLAYHAWTEPMERALAEGRKRAATLVAPKPGQSFDPTSPPPIEPWWPHVPWKTGEQDPIVSTKMN